MQKRLKISLNVPLFLRNTKKKCALAKAQEFEQNSTDFSRHSATQKQQHQTRHRRRHLSALSSLQLPSPSQLHFDRARGPRAPPRNQPQSRAVSSPQKSRHFAKPRQEASPRERPRNAPPKHFRLMTPATPCRPSPRLHPLRLPRPLLLSPQHEGEARRRRSKTLAAERSASLARRSATRTPNSCATSTGPAGNKPSPTARLLAAASCGRHDRAATSASETQTCSPTPTTQHCTSWQHKLTTTTRPRPSGSATLPASTLTTGTRTC